MFKYVNKFLSIIFIFTCFSQNISASEIIDNEPIIENTYKDVEGHKYETYIEELASKKLISGYPDGTFKPDNKITRAEFVSLLSPLEFYSISQEPSFNDVKVEDWFYEYVTFIAKAGLIKGYEGNIFKPQNNITRFEVISILSNFIRNENYTSIQLPYSDTASIPLWANNSVKNLYASGIIADYENNIINGNETITRGEVAAMLDKIMNIYNWDISDIANSILKNHINPLPIQPEIPHDYIGYISINSIGINNYPIKDGADLETIKTAIGHFSESSNWNGNVALCGHNRDYKYDFRNLKNIKVGDEVKYKTRFGERTYKVTLKTSIDETDWSYTTSNSETNTITMITCIEEQPSKRLLVQATQKV